MNFIWRNYVNLASSQLLSDTNLEQEILKADAELTGLREAVEAARRYSRASGLGDLYTFLEWFADRCVHVYGESENVDFVIAAREKGRALNAALRDYDAGREGR